MPRGRALIRNGALLRDTALFNSRETANCAKKSFDVCLKRINKTGEWTHCPWIFPGQEEPQSNCRRKIRRRDHSFEGTTHMDITVERLRRRPLFCIIRFEASD